MPQEPTATESTGTCEHCRYWDYTTDERARAGFGVCRRRAPMPLTVEGDPKSKTWRSELGDTIWPVVAGSDWCGDFKQAFPGN